MKGNFHVWCEVGENLKITSKSYLSLWYQIAKKKKLKGLKCVAYVAGYTAINSINPFKVAKKAIKCVKAVKKGSKLLKTTKRLKTTKALFKKTKKIKKFSFKKKSSAKKYTKKKAVTTTKKRKKGNAPNRAKFKKQKKQGGGACFTEDTLILTENGLVEIDEIEVGDFVWSENPETGDITLKEVKETFVNKTDILVYITVNNETIKTTKGHVFYVENVGWLPANMLKQGDILSLEDGRELPIQSIKEVTYSYYINVYNFEVEDYHTYYVSDSSILVHNMCARGKKNPKYRITGRLTENQDALLKIAQEAEDNAKKYKYITYEEAKILDEWAEEYKVPQHHKAYKGSGKHASFGLDHTHILNVHVPYKY